MIYPLYNTRPDIAFVVEQLSKHNNNLKKDYLWAAKKVVRYLKGTIEMKLSFGWEEKCLPKDLLPYKLICFANNNFARDLENWKSVMSYYFFLNRVVVS